MIYNDSDRPTDESCQKMGEALRDMPPTPSSYVVRSGERTSRGRGVALMGLAASLGALGLSLGHARRSFGDLGRTIRKVRVNPQHETTVYRSRGHGNQHTPPNYPKTRRKRRTRRERSQDQCAAMWSLDGYDGWAKRAFAKRDQPLMQTEGYPTS